MRFRNSESRHNSTRYTIDDWVRSNPSAMALLLEYGSALRAAGYDEENAGLGERYALAVTLNTVSRQ